MFDIVLDKSRRHGIGGGMLLIGMFFVRAGMMVPGLSILILGVIILWKKSSKEIKEH